MSLDVTLLVLAVAMCVEALAGYPPWLYQRIKHPVVWIGGMIAAFDNRLNVETESFDARRMAGVTALLGMLCVVGFLAYAVEIFLLVLPFGFLLVGLAASSLLAGRSLDQHVTAVAEALELPKGGLAAGRTAVAQIVGRNTAALDRAGVARAAIESLAENFSDGVAAPAFWLGVAGLPGAALYKAINTADSMIGHKTPRHLAFGWSAARLDDWVNLPASRLTALYLVLAAAFLPGADPGNAWRAVWRDARKHRSPNAGWPEAAMAGALGLKLNGPKLYGDVLSEDAYMGDGRADVGPQDIRRALVLFRLANALMILTVLGLAAVVHLGF